MSKKGNEKNGRNKNMQQKGESMKVRCMACSKNTMGGRFECDEDDHTSMTLHLWEEHTTKVREYNKRVKA